MSEIILAIIILALIGFIGWREYAHSKQIERLLCFVKANTPAELADWRDANDIEPEKPPVETEEEINLEDVTQEDIKKIIQA